MSADGDAANRCDRARAVLQLMSTLPPQPSIKMQMFHLNSLPNDCLRLILEQCSLMELLSLRLVCTRWQLLIEEMCRVRGSLSVFECSEDIAEYHSMRYYFLENRRSNTEVNINFAAGDNVLITGPGGDLLRHLGDLFPNCKKLLLLYTRACLALTESAPPTSLRSLTILSKRRSTEIAAKFWNWIDGLSNLQSLSLFGMFDSRLPDSLKALSRLEVFSLSGYSHDIVPIVSQLGPPLRHLLLDRLSLPVGCLERLFLDTPPRQCISALTHLSIGSLNTGMVSSKGYLEKIKQYMSFFCRHFRQLRFLQVRFALQIELTHLVSELRRLPSLTELRLAQIGSTNPKDEPDRGTLQSLPSVKRLILECTTAKAAQDTFWKVWIPIIFPNAKTIIAPECSLDSQHGLRLNHMRVQ